MEPKQISVEASRNKPLLIVGDWVVDDYWVTGIHRSKTASRKGLTHFRALHGTGGIVQALVGAGRVASRLFSVPLEVVGLGLWYPPDTDMLTAMFVQENLRGWTPTRLSRDKPPEVKEGVKLVNLRELLYPVHSSNLQKEIETPCATTRVFRVYQRKGKDIDLLARIDWELPPDNLGEHRTWVNEKNYQDLEANGAAHPLFSDPNHYSAIVIKDLGKGVVSDHLIEWLTRTFPSTPWFVSSKRWEPTWLKKLKGQDVRLLLIPQIACQEATERKEVQLFSWFTKSAAPPRPTFEALKAIDAIGDIVRSPKSPTLRVMALPNGYSVIAKDFFEQESSVYQAHPEPVEFNKVGAMASLFFPKVIAELLGNASLKSDFLVESGLDYVQVFGEYEREWLKRSSDIAPCEPPIKISRAQATIVKNTFPITEFNWREEREAWNEAMSDIGVLKRGERRIELWRGMTEVDGFACCIDEKRECIADLMRRIHRFSETRHDEREHLSGLLLARPGSGKTSLVRQLARSLDLRFLDFNITQMRVRDDIIACFDTILTTQAQDRRKPVLVFFDEINAKINNQYVYDAFLSPLEDGTFYRDGKKYYLRPCVWLFATTAKPTTTDPDDKWLDFESRLSIEQLDLTDGEPQAKSYIENVYRGVAMIQAAFPDVGEISECLLRMLGGVPVKIEPRKLRKIIRSFENVQYGQVSLSNVPKEHRKKLWKKATKIDEEAQKDDRKWVRIVR
jgi:hypothetical protein